MRYSGIYKTRSGNYRCIIQWRKKVYHLGTTADEETAVVIRDRVAQHLCCPKRMLNLPGRRLKPMSVEEATANLDRAAKAANPGRCLGVQKTKSGRYKSVIQWKNEVHWLGEATTREKAVWIRERVARHLGCRGRMLNLPDRKLKPLSIEDAKTLLRRDSKQLRPW